MPKIVGGGLEVGGLELPEQGEDLAVGQLPAQLDDPLQQQRRIRLAVASTAYRSPM